MQGSNEPSILATASILAPPGMQQLGARRLQVHLKPNDRVRVRRSEACFKLAEIPGHNYYRTLREKLGWGGRLNLER